MKEDLINLTAEFLKAKRKERVSLATLEHYEFYLHRFFNLMNLTAPEEVNYQNIRAFRLKLNKLKLSQATQNYHLIALRSFLKFLNEENLNNLDPKKIYLNPAKIKKREPVAKKEIEKIILAPEEEKIPAIIRKRDKLLLELLFSSRYKVAKIAKLKIKDGGKLNLTQQGKYWLKEYLKERKVRSEFLFVRHDRAAGKSDLKPLTPRSIQRIVQAYAKKAGLRQKVTPESFRKIPQD